MVKADIIVLDTRYKALTPVVDDILEKAGKALGFSDARVEVYIVNDAQMEEVARQAHHTNHGGITVLSFPATQHFPRPDLYDVRDGGELYINPGYIEKQKEDFSYMFIHGLLHLAGYDHTEEHDTLIMKTKEKELMRAIHAQNP